MTNARSHKPAPLPEPPYYAVIFSSVMSDNTRGYGVMADRMEQLARQQPGYLGLETARDPGGLGITVSYWADGDALANWKQVAEHLLAQKMGRERWYKYYRLRIARVERQYQGPEGR